MKTASKLSDPVALLRSLSADEIEQRLSSLIDEERALRTLLRSVRARDRAARRKAEIKRQGVER